MDGGPAQTVFLSDEERASVVPAHPADGRGNIPALKTVFDPVKRSDLRPLVRLRSTAGTGVTYVTRKNRRNDPDRMELRKYDPVVRQHVTFREER